MRALVRVLLVGVLLGVAYLNYQLYYQPTFLPIAGRTLNQDVLRQLRFLKTRLHRGAAEDMQQLYPEGFVYLNTLYCLAWVELAAGVPATNTLHQEALTEASWAIHAIDSSTGRAPFDQDLPIPYGAYYHGWLTYVLGRYLAVQAPAQRAAKDMALFEFRCAQIAQGLAQSASPYPESYLGAAWPADGVMCVAALACHDRLLPPRYQPTIRQWLTAVDTHLDSLGLIPHQTGASTGQVLEAARGSSQSQILNFLIEIDSTYARRCFPIYRAHFLTSRLGLPGMREAAQPNREAEDIDSGPVIWGVGGAASIVGRRTLQRYGDHTTAIGLRNSVEAFGVAFQSGGQKRYLFGQLPIADAFIAWSNSLEINQAMPVAAPQWRLRFQGLSVLVATGLVFALFALRSKPVR